MACQCLILIFDTKKFDERFKSLTETLSGESGLKRLLDSGKQNIGKISKEFASVFEKRDFGKVFENVKKSILGKGRGMLDGLDEIWNATSKVEKLQDTIAKLQEKNILSEKKGLFAIGEAAIKEKIDALDEYSKSIVSAVQSGEAAGSSMLTLQKHVGAVGLKAKAASLGVGLLRTALNTLVPMLIVEGIRMLVDHFTQAGERAAEAAEQARRAMSEASQAVEDAKGKAEELGTAYETLNAKAKRVGGTDKLSTEEYDEFIRINEEILSLFPQVSSSFDAHGNRIANLTNAVDSLNKEYEEVIRNQKAVAEAAGGDLWKGFRKNQREPVQALEALRELSDKTQQFKAGKISEDDFVRYWALKGGSVHGVGELFEAAGEKYKGSGTDAFMRTGLALDDDALSVLNKVIRHAEATMLPEAEEKTASIRERLIAGFELTEEDNRKLGEAGLAAVTAYVNGLNAADLAGIDEKGIAGVREDILAILFGEADEDIRGAASELYASLTQAYTQAVADSTTGSAGTFVQLRKDLTAQLESLYGEADVPEGMATLFGQIGEEIADLYDTVNSAVEAGSIDGLTIAQLEIAYRLVYGGASYDSADELMAAIAAEEAQAAEVAAQKSRVRELEVEKTAAQRANEMKEARGGTLNAADRDTIVGINTQLMTEREAELATQNDALAELTEGTEAYEKKLEEVQDTEEALHELRRESAELARANREEESAALEATLSLRAANVEALEAELTGQEQLGRATRQTYAELAGAYAQYASGRVAQAAKLEAALRADMSAGLLEEGSAAYTGRIEAIRAAYEAASGAIESLRGLEGRSLETQIVPYQNAADELETITSQIQAQYELAEAAGEVKDTYAYYSTLTRSGEEQIRILEQMPLPIPKM